MIKPGFCLLGLLIAIAPLRADWKITTVMTDLNGSESVATEYYKGKLRRSDTEVNGAHRSVFVMDAENRRQTMWDPGAKQYVDLSTPRVAPRTMEVAEPGPTTRPVLLLESNTTDTGERQTFFGRSARHLITIEKRLREEIPGAESRLESEKTTDGWYLDLNGFPQSRAIGAFYTLLAGSERPVFKAIHTGAPLSGLAVREKITARFVNSPSATREIQSTREVRELSEGVLPANLFEPPSDYKRVAELANPYMRPRSFSDEIEAYWNVVENWFLSWFS